MEITCHRCGLEWETKSTHTYVSCPSCLTKVKVERSFEDDVTKANRPEMRKVWNFLFKKVFPDIESIDWLEKDQKAQRTYGTDLVIKTIKGRQYSIDVKTRDNRYYKLNNWLLEIVHHYWKDKTKKQYLFAKPGWLYKSTADIIFIGTYNENEDNIIEFCAFSLTPFKEEGFKSEITKLQNKWAPPTSYSNSWQLTLNAMVNKDFLRNNAHFFRYWNKDDGME